MRAFASAKYLMLFPLNKDQSCKDKLLYMSTKSRDFPSKEYKSSVLFYKSILLFYKSTEPLHSLIGKSLQLLGSWFRISQQETLWKTWLPGKGTQNSFLLVTFVTEIVELVIQAHLRLAFCSLGIHYDINCIEQKWVQNIWFRCKI